MKTAQLFLCYCNSSVIFELTHQQLCAQRSTNSYTLTIKKKKKNDKV